MHPSLVARRQRGIRTRRSIRLAALLFAGVPLLAGLTIPSAEDEDVVARYEGGAGRPLLLLHGAPGGASDWNIVWAPLAADFHAIAIDRPGYGKSRRGVFTAGLQGNVDAAHRVISRRAVGPMIIVGFSYGTVVALALAQQHPEDVAALVLGSTVFRRHPAPVLLSVFELPVYGPGLARVVGALARPWMPQARVFEHPKVTCTLAGEAQAFDEDLARVLADPAIVTIPVEVVNGADDPRTPAGDPALPPTVRDAVLRVLPGKGHDWVASEPGVLVDAVRAAAHRAWHGAN